MNMNANISLLRLACCFLFAVGLILSISLLQEAATPSQSKATETPVLAPTPPMGWNSWDAYGEVVPEADVRQSARFMAENLKSFGWQYITVDMGWYVTNHSVGVNAESAEF